MLLAVQEDKNSLLSEFLLCHRSPGAVLPGKLNPASPLNTQFTQLLFGKCQMGERLGMPSASIVPPTMCMEQTQRFPLRPGATELGPVSPSKRKGALQDVLPKKRALQLQEKVLVIMVFLDLFIQVKQECNRKD